MATNASSQLITALKASLADSTNGWHVLAVTDSTSTRIASVQGTIVVNPVTSNLAQGAASVGSTSVSDGNGVLRASVTIPALSIPALTGGVTGGDGGGTVTSTPTTTVTTVVSLEAGTTTEVVDGETVTVPLVSFNNAPRPMNFLYTSTWIDGVFSEGSLSIAQAKLRTTDTALDTTIRTLATAFLSSLDAAVVTALTA